LAGFEVLTAVVLMSSISWDIRLCLLIHAVSCLAYTSTLKMEPTYYFETSVEFQLIAST
jgi:hypothetical protein